MQFFDDAELALLLEATAGSVEQYLVTIRHAELEMSSVPIPQRSLGDVANDVDQAFLDVSLFLRWNLDEADGLSSLCNPFLYIEVDYCLRRS
jgi:hypothetical protein